MAADLDAAAIRLLVLGRPGSGKGTQGGRLARVLRVPHVSTGDLLRAEIDRDGATGRQIAGALAAGRLVPDPLVGAALATRIAAPDARQRGFVLDGYPRSVSQAITLERLLAPARITVALELLVPEREAAHRLLSRFVCTRCGQPAAGRAIGDAMPTTSCTRCGGALRRRVDDDVSVIRRRFEEFESTTKPLLEWLDRRHMLVSVDADHPTDVVTAAVLEALDPVLTRAGAPPLATGLTA